MIFKKALLLLLLAATNFKLFATDTKSTFGVETGPNLVTMRGSAVFNALKSNVRWHAGISWQYDFSKQFSIKSVLAYDGKGAKAPNMIVILDSLGTTTGEVTPYINNNYLTLSALARYSIGKKIKYFMNAGPYIGYLLSRRDFVRGENIDPLTMYKGREFDKILDFGASIGIGVVIPVWNKFACSAEVRGNWGLYNIQVKQSPGLEMVKTRAISFLFGIDYYL